MKKTRRGAGNRRVGNVVFRYIYLVTIIIDTILMIPFGIASMLSILLANVAAPLIASTGTVVYCNGICQLLHGLNTFVIMFFPRLPFIDGVYLHTVVWISIFQVTLILAIIVVLLAQKCAWSGFNHTDMNAAFIFSAFKAITAVGCFYGLAYWSSGYLELAAVYHSFVAFVAIMFAVGL